MRAEGCRGPRKKRRKEKERVCVRCGRRVRMIAVRITHRRVVIVCPYCKTSIRRED